MEFNINVTLGITPDAKETIDKFVKAFEALHEEKISARKDRELLQGILKATCDANQKPEEDAKESNTETPAPEPTKKARRSRKAAAPEPAPEEPKEEEPAPAPEESTPAPATDLFEDKPAEEPAPQPAPETHEMGILEWKEILAATRQRLLLEDGQENFEHKREFNNLVRKMAKYYGGERPAELTPSNLYWCAKQVESIQFNGNEFLFLEPLISEEQVAANQNAPF